MMGSEIFTKVSDELQNSFYVFFFLDFYFLVISFENVKQTLNSKTSHCSAYYLTLNLQLDRANQVISCFNIGYQGEVPHGKINLCF